MTLPVSWTCPTCRTAVATQYCPACGERVLDARELTLRGLARQVFASLSNIDTRLLRSLHALVTRPGTLTRAYLEGQRQPYILPFPLFLFANLIFFGVESLTSASIFSTPLHMHLHQQMWSDIAAPWIAHRLASLHMSFDDYAPLFDRVVETNAKTLIILMAVA